MNREDFTGYGMAEYNERAAVGEHPKKYDTGQS